MNDRIEALKKLKAKVESGEASGHDIAICFYGFRDLHPVRGEGRMAYDGSLDAARALHEAVVPEISQYSIVTDPTCLQVKIAAWPNGLAGDVCLQGEGWGMPGEDARAYLIAILDLLISQAEQSQ